ncbi:hypothetical protein OOJ91_12100 [Micromonospora lupini]|uniref:hypothetical protein n=1 Tax=Micromonospora lupini TaxID=285679 RepID=UPI00224E4E59|nr:hypothetical protein [Micromonospora lupini]MCX5066620.1 hypothetical protein [Micromonospora lupini]
MAVLVVVDLCCDRCKTSFAARPEARRDAGTIRAAAQAAGWQVVGEPGSRTDRCPADRTIRRVAA